ncbi:MAG: hypothetical protein QW497_05830 [Candidatus Bathyarchaeia archaeon]
MRRRSLKESLERYVVDAGVLIEYIVKGSPYREAVKKMLDDVLAKVTELYLTPITVFRNHIRSG